MRSFTNKRKKKVGVNPLFIYVSMYIYIYIYIYIEISIHILLTHTGDEVEQSWLSLYSVKRDLTRANKDRLKVWRTKGLTLGVGDIE